MREKTKRLAHLALLTALTVLSLYAAALAPSGNAGLAALGSVCGVLAVAEAGFAGGAAVFFAAGALGFFLLPDKNPWLLYLCFFGWYPLLKGAAERFAKGVTQWILKLIGFNLGAIALLWLAQRGLFSGMETVLENPFLLLGLNAVFVLFDLGLTQAVGVYVRRVLPYIK